VHKGFLVILSSEIFIILPLPDTHVKWVWRIGVVYIHNFHMGNSLSSFRGWSRHLFMLVWNYFLIEVSFHYSSFPDISRQRTLSPIAKFIRIGSLISRPPFSFGALNVFQLMRWIFFVCWFSHLATWTYAFIFQLIAWHLLVPTRVNIEK